MQIGNRIVLDNGGFRFVPAVIYVLLLSKQNVVLDGRARTVSAKTHRCAFVVSYDFVRTEGKHAHQRCAFSERNQYKNGQKGQDCLKIPPFDTPDKSGRAKEDTGGQKRFD